MSVGTVPLFGRFTSLAIVATVVEAYFMMKPFDEVATPTKAVPALLV